MKFQKTVLAAAMLGASVSAYAVPTVMTVTSAQFGMGFFTGGGYLPAAAYLYGTGAADITDQVSSIGFTPTAAQPSGVAGAGSIVSFTFGTGATDQVNTYTVGTAPVFTGAFANGATTFDISSFTAAWNGTVFNQGNSAAAMTLSGCTGTSCNYTMSWMSTIVGGPFNGQTGSWVLGGTIAAVPEASTYGMMAAGLAMVGFVARRRTRSAV